MTITLNDIWKEFTDIIRSSDKNSDMALKMRAVNQANDFMLRMAIDMKLNPEEYIKSSNLTNDASVNYVTIPTDFLTNQVLWYLSSSSYYPFHPNNIITLEKLKRNIQSNFYDTTDTGLASHAAFAGTKIYFDKHFAASGTTNIKLDYYKLPTSMTADDKITYTAVLGTFAVGDVVTGETSGAVATVNEVASGYITVTTESRYDNGDVAFVVGETITDATLAKTGTVTAFTEKVETFEWSDKFKLILPAACATIFFELEGSMEVSEKEDSMIALLKRIHNISPRGYKQIRLS